MKKAENTRILAVFGVHRVLFCKKTYNFNDLCILDYLSQE